VLLLDVFVFVLQLESLKAQHEKIEKQSVSVQARLTNLQVTSQSSCLFCCLKRKSYLGL